MRTPRAKEQGKVILCPSLIFVVVVGGVQARVSPRTVYPWRVQLSKVI